MRIMAIDFGDSRTGVAVSDLSGSIVGETLMLKVSGIRSMVAALAPIVERTKPERIVVGYPKNMNGTPGPRAEKSELVAEELQKAFGLETVLWDERLTTVSAHRILDEAGRHGKKRKNTVDAVAASLILEGYLSSLR